MDQRHAGRRRRWPVLLGRRPAAVAAALLLGVSLVVAVVARASATPIMSIQTLTATSILILAVLLHRRSPTAALVLAASTSLFFISGNPDAWQVIIAAVPSFLAGRHSRLIWAPQFGIVAVAAAGLLLAVALGNISGWITMLLVEFVTAALPWWAGSWWRQRTELARAGWQRAEQLERERRIVVEQARLRERTRIARDMHDSLGHELSLVSLLAGSLELARDLPEAHRVTATRLRASTVSATKRLHEVVGLLRLDAEPASVEPAGGDITALVQHARDSGVPVTLQRSGCPDTATRPGTTADRAAYRVVQEALTNAAKHAPGAEVVVRIDRSATDSTVSVANTAPPRAPANRPEGSGVGLVGLSERVRVAGGTLGAGPHHGGFRVVARLPHAPPQLAGVPAAPELTGEFIRTRQRLRAHLFRRAILPGTLALVTVGTLVAVYTATVATTSLSPDDFARLQVGQTRAEMAARLPAHRIASAPPVLTQPPAPTGARCEYYRASQRLIDLSENMYRLCFTDDVLVSKDVLQR
ncbi:sensor histidine kinase [Micromonospora sp. C51]|uniref:sensor histidine kinase n=1 Tax=Micromonospora sp. C51 TaxID=2824879 RepID=UPI001B35E782|nr:histidine kinase [Micromonospora sp. C51]MBQ1052053.1 sensor histidine kinase [Micromonospora sp. C51]